MRPLVARWAGWLVLLLAGLSLAPADARAQVSNSGQRVATLGPTDFLNAALFVIGSVDRYEIAEIWEKSSPIMKASVAKDQFIASVAQRRATLGGVTGRDWIAIMRVIISEKTAPLPPGRYISVRFRTTGQSGKSLEEVVSFHLDTDGQWKMAGYSIL